MSSSTEYANLGKRVVWKVKNRTEDLDEERTKKGRNKWVKSFHSLGVASMVHTDGVTPSWYVRLGHTCRCEQGY